MKENRWLRKGGGSDSFPFCLSPKATHSVFPLAEERDLHVPAVSCLTPMWTNADIHFHNGLNNCFCLSPLLIEGFQMKCGHLLQKYLPSVTNINRQNKQISAGCFIDIHITQTQTHTKSSPVQTNTRQISQRGWLKMLIASKNSSIVA